MGTLSTGSAKLDNLLGGGVEGGTVTLLYGEGGSGKTNLCLMLAKSAVQSGTKVLYIDTEGVSMQRLSQIAGTEVETVSKNILFSEPYDMKEQSRLISKGIKLLDNKNRIGLIVVDSLTMFFRMTRTEDGDERRDLNEQLSMLLNAARRFTIPVVVTSQVYTDINTGTIEPLGGHIMLHAAKTIVRLERLPAGRRRATLMKHRHLRELTSSEFVITEGGLE